MSSGSSLIIEELDAVAGAVTASAGDRRRNLTLVGAGLPFMGAEWGGEMALVTTWYEGNPDEATQQVLGPRELPSTWQGMWRRTLLGKTPATYVDESGTFNSLVDPLDLWNVLEDICRSGRRLRVTWAVTSAGDHSGRGRVVREGRAKSFKFRPDRLEDIAWEVEFHWASRGQQQLRVSDARPHRATADGDALVAAVDKLRQQAFQAQLQKFNPHPLTLGQLEQIASAPTKLVTQVTRQVQQITSNVSRVVGIAKTLDSQPAQVANAVVDQAHNCVSQLNNMTDSLGEVPYELMTTQSKAESVLRAAKHFGQTSDAAALAARSAQDFATRLAPSVAALAPLSGRPSPRRTAAPGSVLKLHVVKAGETPQSISVLYYGTPDHAVDILKANRMSWYTPTVPPGKILLVPVLAGDDQLARGG